MSEIQYVDMPLCKSIRLMDGRFDTEENADRYLFDITDSRRIGHKLLVRPPCVTGFRTS